MVGAITFEVQQPPVEGKRMQHLTTYCHAIKGDITTLQKAIGVSAEPFSEGEGSFEFIYVDHSMPSIGQASANSSSAASRAVLTRSSAEYWPDDSSMM